MKTTVCMTPLTLGYPEGGGHLWVYLNWALSLRALDCRVIWLEDIGEHAATRPRAEVERDIATLGARLESYGLGGALALTSFTGHELDAGLVDGRPDLDVAAAEADVMLDFAYDTPAWALAMFRRTALVEYTTVTNWWEGWIELDDEPVCNDKRIAFLEYAELPARTNQPLEMALTLDDYTADTDVPLLERAGWTVRDAWEACATPDDYRAYIQGSRAEFSCAKPSCGLLANAWISDRTICYLASAKPAVVEHTGPSSFLPEAEGLLRFRNIDEAAAAIEAVESDYERHCRLARELAEEHFDGEKVVRRVLELALA